MHGGGEIIQLQNIKYLRWGYEFLRLSSNYTANWVYGSEKIKAKYQEDCNALHEAMVELESYYEISRQDQFREGESPLYWNEVFERIAEIEMETVPDEWLPSNQKKAA